MGKNIYITEGQLRKIVGMVNEDINGGLTNGNQQNSNGQQQGMEDINNLKNILSNTVKDVDSTIDETLTMCIQINRISQAYRSYNASNMNEARNNNTESMRTMVGQYGNNIKINIKTIANHYNMMYKELTSMSTTYANSGFSGVAKQWLMKNTGIGRSISALMGAYKRNKLSEDTMNRNLGGQYENLKNIIQKIWYGTLTKCYNFASSNSWSNLYQFLQQLKRENTELSTYIQNIK